MRQLTRFYTKERLYELLPRIYRQRDTGHAVLESLLGVISNQIGILEDEIERLYDGFFIETCHNSLIPYIAELVGIRWLPPCSEMFLRQRSLVANAVSYGLRKGTVNVIEQLSSDITGLSSRVVEFFQLLVTTQNINHLRLDNLQCPDLRDAEALTLINTPFDRISHTVDVRSIRKNKGFHNIPNIGIFLWRLRSFAVTEAPAYYHAKGRFSFNQLGFDMQLFNRGPRMKQKMEDHDIAVNPKLRIEMPIDRIDLFKNLDAYYSKDGYNKSIQILIDGEPLEPDDIEICDLSTWQKPYDRIGEGLREEGGSGNNEQKQMTDGSTSVSKSSSRVMVDPVLGRILLPDIKARPKLYVSYCYGFNGMIGGGSYQRPPININTCGWKIYRISKKEINKRGCDNGSSSRRSNTYHSSIKDALDCWINDNKPSAIFEISDNEVYYEDIQLSLYPRTWIIFRSLQYQRPVISGFINITQANQCTIILEGLWLTGHALKPARNIKDDRNYNSSNDNSSSSNSNNNKKNNDNVPVVSISEHSLLRELHIVHCTLLPQTSPALEVRSCASNRLSIVIDHSITGKINISSTPCSEVELRISSSVIDSKILKVDKATSKFSYSKSFDDYVAISCDGSAFIQNATVFGKVETLTLNMGCNSIFTEKIRVRNRQLGCIRFCYFPEGSQVPKSFHCQPIKKCEGVMDECESKNNVCPNIKPLFTSEFFAQPGYAQLHRLVAYEILYGADNGSEMGAFNFIHQAQRIDIFKSYLHDYLPVGMEFGVILVN